MYLKHLEMQGFKSFPEKIRLKFGKGITAVVGPNGSGKSNVADAVRWVLGEAGSRNLRGQKMEDVIFAGTQNRKPLGFAEVSLVMDNSDRKLNLDFEEVTVTRRLFRSGESAYLINGTPCRRRDILELFMDTGVGKEGYSIIGQGRIDEILSIKSEDRRALFEEAAGIVKFKNRRTEAQKKLENEHANLQRAEDIIRETESRLGPLEKAAEKAEEYIRLAEKLKQADINIFVLDAEKFEVQIKKLSEAAESLAVQTDEVTEALRKAEREQNARKESSEKINYEIDVLSKTINELTLSRSEKLNDINLLNNDAEHMNKDIRRIEDSIKGALISEQEKNGLIESGRTVIRLKTAELKNAENKAASAENDYAELRKMLAETEEALAAYNDSIIDIMEKIAFEKEEAAKTSQLIETNNSQLARAESERLINEGMLNEKLTSVKALENSLGSLGEKALTLESEHNSLLEESRLAAQKAQQLDKAHRRAVSELNDCKSRISILTELENSYEGYFGGVKAILRQRDSMSSKGICGAVGEVISTDRKYRLAIETALGSSLQNIITEDEEAAKQAINYLKTTGSGRATFMPITASPKSTFTTKPEITGARGFVGMADSLVGCDEKYRGIILNLLGRTAVIDNMDNAVELAKKIRYSNRIVTLTGEVLSPGGSITGGSKAKKSAGILSRRADLKELNEKLNSLKLSRDNAASELEKINFNLDSIKKDIEKNRQEFNRNNLSLSTAEARLNSEKHSAAEIKARMDKQGEESALLKDKNASAAVRLKDCEGRLADLENRLKALNEGLDNSRGENSDLREELDEKYRILTQCRVEAEKIQAELSGENEKAERLQTETEEIRASIAEGRAEIESYKKRIDNSRREAEKKSKEADDIDTEIAGLNEMHDNMLRERYELSGIISEAESDIKGYNETLVNLNSEKTRQEERLETVKEKNKALFDSMWETYEITYPEALRAEKSELSLPELHKLSADLKAKIKGLGSINPTAPEEYRQTKARFEFLSEQKNDIIKAEDDLRQIIDKLETLMREQFTNQFKIINENFKQVFREMFGGGHADISLSDESDVLNSGIEINAQPPGKKLQSMLLLSGGEKALTAMALLFAILRMKPSPFCLLDEIEAALDDSNVTRYAKYIKRLSDTTQFVVITHRKGTMEEADSLYGITMQEQGISKMVSVSLKEANALSDQQGG